MITVCEKTACELFREWKLLLVQQEEIYMNVKLGNGKTEKDLEDFRKISNRKLSEYFDAEEAERA